LSAAAEQRVTRKYGGPFAGCVSSVDRHEVPLNGIGADSREILIEPGRVPDLGKAKRRHGAAGVGSSTGVCEMTPSLATLRGLEAWELPTLVSGDGFPVLSVLWADESKRLGHLFYHDGATDHVHLSEFGSLHYPTAASTQGNIKMPPLPYDGNGATGYTRGAFADARARVCPGTRKHVGIKNREYMGSFYGTPSSWNREYNLSSGSGSNNLVHYPTGHIMPLWPPNFPAASYPTRTTTPAAWGEGDMFFASVAFIAEDGSMSMPYIPRDKNSVLTAGLGLVTVDDDGDATAEYFSYIPWRDIPIGPPGTKRRALLRSNKKTKLQIAGGEWPDISTLKVCGYLDDNTSTSYNDPRGNDAALYADPLLRTDQVWPSSGRYDWAFDQRHATGYLRPNPCALVIAPSGLTVSRDINAGYDDASLVGSTAFLVQLRQDSAGALTLNLRKTAFGVAVPTNTTIALAAATTLQTLCDTINATVIGGAGGEWVCQIVPGANANADVTKLAPTHIDRAGGTWTNGSTTLNITDATDVAEGMKVNDAKWPAGTYVKSKSGNALTMSAQSTGAQAAPADVEFYVDAGDDPLFTDATAHSQYGNLRAYGNAIPVLIAFKRSYLDTFPTDKRDFMVTTGGPLQVPNAAHMFHTSPGGRFQGESDAGILMGGAPLHNGCVVFYSNRIGYYRNQRAGSTGEDADYRMDWILNGHGCKSPYSIVYGNNWVGCWTDAGYWVFDGNDSAFITGTIYDPNTRKGELSYEAGLCNASAASDTNDYYMHAHYRDGRLWLNYRTDATHWATSCYDCSASIEGSGLRQVLNPQGVPYGWSSRLRYSWRSSNAGCGGAITSVRKSDGVHLYQCDDKNDKANCGLVQEFETTGGWTDGADQVLWTLYLTTDMLGGMRKSSLVERPIVLYRQKVSSGSTTLFGVVYRTQQRLTAVPFLLPETTGDFFTRKPVGIGMAARAPGEVVEFMFTGGTVATEQDFELSLVECEADILESLT
jgi:hypothetical protein